MGGGGVGVSGSGHYSLEGIHQLAKRMLWLMINLGAHLFGSLCELSEGGHEEKNLLGGISTFGGGKLSQLDNHNAAIYG